MEPLPNELVDCVIENLYSDTRSLLSCALVGRAWVRSSQHGIFRYISLSLPPLLEDYAMGQRDAYRNTTRKLAAAFDSTPHLATYVRSLILQDFFDEDELHIATANVIRQLSSLKHLAFGRINWAVLSPTLKAVLAALFRTPSLTESGFFYTSSAEVMPLLNQMPRQLKVLHLTWIHLDNLGEKMEQNDLPPKSIQLEKLTINGCYGVDWFLKDTCPFEIRNLQSLVISEWTGRNMGRLLHYVGRSLRELELDISTACSDCLTYVPNLHILHLRSNLLTSSSSPLLMLCTMFEPFFNPDGNECSLQCLKIDFIIDCISQLVNDLAEWAEIDELLNRPELSVLERVDMNLRTRTCLDLSGAGNLLRGKLHILEASGKLYIHCF